MTQQYLNTKDLCERYRCSSRTIFRKMKRRVNPLPSPAIKYEGSSNLWLVDSILAWEVAEMKRSQSDTTH